MSRPVCNSSPIWLDLLPEPVCEHIAAFLNPRSKSIDALHLALATPKQRDAVVAAFERRLALTEPFDEAWLPCFHTDFRALSSYATCGSKCLLTALLTSSTFNNVALQAVQVSGVVTPQLLAALAAVPNLTHFDLFPYSTVWTRDHYVALFNLIEARDLRHLGLECSKSHCFHVEKDAVRGIQTRAFRAHIANRCPNLQSLTLKCEYADPDFSPLIESLPSVTSCTVSFTNVPEERSFLPALRRMRSVTILEAPQELGGIEMAVSVGPPVVNLTDDSPRTGAELSTLSACPNLRHLCLYLIRGGHSEEALVDVAPMLESLSLKWRAYTVNEVRDQPGEYEYRQSYTSPQTGALLRVVQSKQRLHSLCLQHVRISREELICIMREIGDRMAQFTVSIRDQGEPPEERLASLMHAAATYNKKLKEFSVVDYCPWEPAKDACSELASKRRRTEWVSRSASKNIMELGNVLDILRRHAVSLDTASLGETVKDLTKWISNG